MINYTAGKKEIELPPAVSMSTVIAYSYICFMHADSISPNILIDDLSISRQKRSRSRQCPDREPAASTSPIAMRAHRRIEIYEKGSQEKNQGKSKHIFEQKEEFCPLLVDAALDEEMWMCMAACIGRRE